MIVSRSRRFAFAHVPKTGGIALRAALAPFEDESLRLPAHDTFRDHPEFADHFKFAFVRNPWDRLVSFYAYARRHLTHLVPAADFDSMLRALDRGDAWTRPIHAFRPQGDFTDGADFVGRFERLDTDFAAICACAGIDARLTHRNASDHRPYAACYTGWSRDFVAARYARDIDLFGYRFEAAA